MGQVGLVALFAVACVGCGAAPAGDATPAEARCAPCHFDDYEHARPTHVGKKPTTCATCHRQDSWRPVAIEHPAFPLDGAHAKADCLACHHDQPPVFAGTHRACIGCHAAAFARQNAVARWHAHFAETCADCHQTTAWRPAQSEPGFDAHAGSPPAASHDPAPTPVPSSHRPRKPAPSPPEAKPSPDPLERDVPDPPEAPDPPDVRTGATRHR